MGFVEQIAIETERQLEERELILGVDWVIPKSIRLRRTLFTTELKSGKWAYHYRLGLYTVTGIRNTREACISALLRDREEGWKIRKAMHNWLRRTA